jgi:hypothetical protein
MNRRQLVAGATLSALSATLASYSSSSEGAPVSNAGPPAPPAKGKIPVAVLLSEGAQVIDFAGPWEVFQGCHVHSRGSTMDEMMPFELFTVAPTKQVCRPASIWRFASSSVTSDATLRRRPPLTWSMRARAGWCDVADVTSLTRGIRLHAHRVKF